MKKVILVIIMVIMVSSVFAAVDKSLFNAIKEKIPALSQKQLTELKILLHEGGIETKGGGFKEYPMTERILKFFLTPWAKKISLITLSKGRGELSILTTKGRLYRVEDLRRVNDQELKTRIIPEIKKELGFK